MYHNYPTYTLVINGQIVAENADMNRVSEVCDDARYLGFPLVTAIDSEGAEATIQIQPVAA